MGHKIIKKLPTADDIIAYAPLSQADEDSIQTHRQEIGQILSGNDKRLIVIIGPCSAWPDTAVYEYAKRLKELQSKVERKIKLVMRVYIQKPRTIRGWLGPVNQSDPFATPDIATGAIYCRKMMTDVIKLGLPIADEALFTHNARGFIELLSWVAIGARSVEDQEHRIFASLCDCAVGMKNATSGSIELAINGVIAAQHPHHTALDGHQIETDGNPFAHLVLRGGYNGSNFDETHVLKAGSLFAKHNVKNPAIIIDASHDNCKVDGVKLPLRQPEIVREVMNMREKNPEYKKLVKGFMLESFIQQGCQKLESCDKQSINYQGLSITDPCIGWDTTEQIITELAKMC